MVNNYTLIIHPVEGKTEIIPRFRDYKVRFRNTRTADSVDIYINGDKANIPYECYEEENDFVVDVKHVDTTKQLTINCKGKDIEINAVRIINEDVNSIISDLKIKTSLKEEIASIFFSNLDIKNKRIQIKKLKGLEPRFKRMFIKLLEYLAEIFSDLFRHADFRPRPLRFRIGSPPRSHSRAPLPFHRKGSCSVS